MWTLPDGTTSTASTISISEVSANDAGIYQLSIRDGGCSSPEGSVNLAIESLSIPIITNDSDLTFCDDGTGTPTLETTALAGILYQWKRDGTDISGATGTSISADQSGDYTVEITNTNNCSIESGSLTILAVDPPTSVPTGVTATCRDFITSFTASSTGQSGFTLEYAWRVDSSGVTLTTSTNPDFDYTFMSLTDFDYDVVLTTSYAASEVTSCEDEVTLVVNVTPPPNISFDQTDVVQKCAAESLNISVTNTGVDTYSWSVRNANTNNANDTIIFPNFSSESLVALSTPTGIDSVYAIVEILTSIGCSVKDSILVKNFPTDVDISSPDFTSILTTDSALLEEAISINLEAVNVVSDFSWEPANQIDNATSSSIVFFLKPDHYCTLTGIDGDGCLVSSAVLIELDNLRPRKTFSPNGDGINDCWEILNIGDLGNTESNVCEVFVFDSRGKT